MCYLNIIQVDDALENVDSNGISAEDLWIEAEDVSGEILAIHEMSNGKWQTVIHKMIVQLYDMNCIPYIFYKFSNDIPDNNFNVFTVLHVSSNCTTTAQQQNKQGECHKCGRSNKRSSGYT